MGSFKERLEDIQRNTFADNDPERHGFMMGARGAEGEAMTANSKAVPGVYAILYSLLRQRANEMGYALAVHGSMARDLDLIAVPWGNDACDPDDLARDLAFLVGGVIEQDENAQPGDFSKRNPQPKPHGRLAYSIQLGGGPYIDLSVMPKIPAPAERDRLQAELDGSERARKNVSAALVIAKEWIEQKDERIHALEEALRWTWSRLDSGDSVVHELGCRRSHLDDEEKPERVCTCGYAAARTLLAPRETPNTNNPPQGGA